MSYNSHIDQTVVRMDMDALKHCWKFMPTYSMKRLVQASVIMLALIGQIIAQQFGPTQLKVIKQAAAWNKGKDNK